MTENTKKLIEAAETPLEAAYLTILSEMVDRSAKKFQLYISDDGEDIEVAYFEPIVEGDTDDA